ncbi:MAG: tandem-95 repeat protein [Novosphingobium sp.]|nr:tandem-95 repeat protein [Novosphingobium sp.]
MAAPTAQEQYLLELINDARLDPMGNAARYISSYSPLISSSSSIQDAINYFNVSGSMLLSAYQNLTAVAPVAWNSDLADAAHKHSAAMIAADEQSHHLAGELDLGDRVKAEGYDFKLLGENVYAYARDMLYAHAGFMIDWGNGPGGMQAPAGHRNNIMWADMTEIGIDVTRETNPSTQVGEYVVTQDFGDRGKLFVLGVAYNDSDNDDFYSMGEGRGDLTVKVGAASTTTYASGGYSLEISAGERTIQLSGGGLSGTVNVTTLIEYDSIKLDVVDGNTLLTSGSVAVEGPVSIIKGIGVLTYGLTLSAGSGNQTIIGNTGRDTLSGGTGNDILIGNENRDVLNGDAGNDELRGGAGDDTLNGGAGNDIAVYSGLHTLYTVRGQADGSIKVSGNGEGTDTVTGVEVFRFSDGDYYWDAAAGALTDNINSAPTVAANQSVSTNEDTATSVIVAGSDSNGDNLTYTSTGAAHGTVTGGAGGQFNYTPQANYNGSDSFKVTVSDGNGGSAVQTVHIDVIAQNDAPTAATSQSVSTPTATPKQVAVVANDVDGDSLTYRSGGAAHGTVTGGADGKFVYKSNAGYSGHDSFSVTISDGQGGSTTQVVNISVTSVNADPVVSGSQSVTTVANTAKQITVSASDADGDTLSYSAGGAAHGSITGGSGGVFTYTPVTGYTGSDSFIVTVSDGQGGNAAQTVNITVNKAVTSPTEPSPASDNGFRLFAPDGYAGLVGGSGSVFGSNAFQDITLSGEGGSVLFDASFNRGGDIVRFSGDADNYTIGLSGSAAIIKNGASSYTIPVGTAGIRLVFDDGVRTLLYDQNAGSVKIGSQSVTSLAKTITAPDDHSALPTGEDSAAVARAYLKENASITVGGDLNVIGTSGGEQVTYRGGSLTLDPSFNKGGDTLHLSNPASQYEAFLSGSTLVLMTPEGQIRIPVGTAGMTLDFDGDLQLLRFDSGEGAVMIGDQAITATSKGSAQALDMIGSGSGTSLSLDIGEPSVAANISLEAGVSYSLSEQTAKTTNVVIDGFDSDDVIHVTGASSSLYNFTTSDADGDGRGDDLVIAYSDGASISNEIVILDAVSPNAFVAGYDSATNAVGHTFMTFG